MPKSLDQGRFQKMSIFEARQEKKEKGVVFCCIVSLGSQVYVSLRSCAILEDDNAIDIVYSLRSIQVEPSEMYKILISLQVQQKPQGTKNANLIKKQRSLDFSSGSNFAKSFDVLDDSRLQFEPDGIRSDNEDPDDITTVCKDRKPKI